MLVMFRCNIRESLPADLDVFEQILFPPLINAALRIVGPLTNCAKDAKHVAECVRYVSEASATPVYNLKDRASMQRALENFLDKIHRPPQVVLIYFSGHGVQEGEAIFLVPTGASPSSACRTTTCFVSSRRSLRIERSQIKVFALFVSLVVLPRVSLPTLLLAALSDHAYVCRHAHGLRKGHFVPSHSRHMPKPSQWK